MGRAIRHSRPWLRHPAEVPYFIFIIVAAILDAAVVLPFLPSGFRTPAGRRLSVPP
jgi:hypothetical protein